MEQCLYVNSESLTNNFESVEILIGKFSPAMIFCTETCVTNAIADAELHIKGYRMVRCDSISRHTGGVVIYVRENISFETVSMDAIDRNMWYLTIKVKTRAIRGTYSELYHSPSSSHANFLNYLERYMAESIDNEMRNVLIGDFNIDLMKSPYANRLVRLCESYSLKQKVDFVTRSTDVSDTKIDLIFTNDDRVWCASLPEEKISDHETIAMYIVNNDTKLRGVEKSIRSWENYSKTELMAKLQTVNWGDWYRGDVDERLTFVQEVLCETVSSLTVEKNIKVKTINKWYDRELTEMNKKKFRLSQLAKNDQMFKDEFQQVKTTYKKLIKRKKSEYIQTQIIESKNDQKLMWKNLKKIVKIKEVARNYDEIMFDNIRCEDNLEISDRFNNYFIDSVIAIQNEIDNIPRRRSDNDNVRMNTINFKFRRVSLEEISEIILSFKSVIGGKKLLTYGVLKDSVEIIAYFYMEIINECLQTGYFPEKWKLSTIVPIPKIAGTTKAEEFRPINTLPADEKIMEMVVKNQLMSYIENNKLLNDAQSGFRENHSCETALNLAVADWKEEINDGKVVVVVFLDLKRAFETIDRDILMEKIESMGIEGVEKRWFESYLSGRMQQTKFNEEISPKRVIDNGLPQGSSLAPILFLLYINDIIRVLNHAKANLFADDTAVAVPHRNAEWAIATMNNELSNVYDWLCGNKLKLNIMKTKYMIIGNKNTSGLHGSIYINNEQIERVSEVKYLGIVIDEKLNFSRNCEYIEKKVAKKIGFMKRSCKFLMREYKVTVYRTIVEPHFTYCASIIFLCTITDMNNLQKLQNRAMRFILRRSWDARTKDMLEELKWLSVYQSSLYYTLILVFKMRNNLLPSYLSNNLRLVSEVHSRNTRNRNDYRLPNYTKQCAQNSLYYRGVKMFNELPWEMRNGSSLANFKRLCFEYVKTKPIRKPCI